jgi:hypothetical protein
MGSSGISAAVKMQASSPPDSTSSSDTRRSSVPDQPAQLSKSKRYMSASSTAVYIMQYSARSSLTPATCTTAMSAESRVITSCP